MYINAPRIAKSFQTSLECISSSSDLVIKLEFLSFSFTSRFVRRCFLSKRPSLHKHYLASSLLCPYPTPSHLLFFSEIISRYRKDLAPSISLGMRMASPVATYVLSVHVVTITPLKKQNVSVRFHFVLLFSPNT